VEQAEALEVLVLFLLAWAWAGCAVAALVALGSRARASRRLGEPLAWERPSRYGRLAAGGGLLAVVAVVGLAGLGPVQTPAALLVVALALLCVALHPSSGERVCGSEGVQVGWESATFGELEEWRLTGDHLRFRLGGHWLAVPLPARLHADVRARLEERAPGRESRFSDRANPDGHGGPTGDLP
jgi:hypothetical protein